MPDAEKSLLIRLAMGVPVVGAAAAFVALRYATPDQTMALAGAMLAASVLLVVFFHRIYQSRLTELHELSTRLAERTQALEQRSSELKRAQAVGNIGSWVSDIPADQIRLSVQGCHILGLEPCRPLTYHDYMDLVHAEDRSALAEAWQLALKGREFDQEHRVLVNGEVHWVRQKAELEFDKKRRPTHAVGTLQDVTNLKRAQVALASSEERYRTMIEWSPDAILVHRVGKILYANPAAVRLFGAPYAQLLLDKPASELIHPDSRAEQATRMENIIRHETIAPMVEAKFLRLDGSVMDVEVQGTAIDFDNELAIQVAVRDITQRKKMERQVRQLAFYDALTQLPNRRLLSDRLNRAIAACRRSGNYGALMFLDLDNFKPLNDRYGHSVGDLLLIEVARRLKACVRELDTVARFGGDEFVVVVEELAPDQGASARLAQGLAEKIRKSLAELYTIEKADANGLANDISHRCTTSIGVVMITRNDNSPEDLVKWADLAMYRAKNNGRNRIHFFDPQKTFVGEFSESVSGYL